MTANLRRGLAVGLTAALAFIGLLTVPAHSAPASAPASCAGVWVVVQSDETKPSSVQIGCATSYTTGLDALASAGFTSAGGSYVNQIDGLPTNTDWVTNGNYYWSYWTAPVGADGTLGTWAFATSGAGTSTPAKGIVEGWRLTVAGTAGPAVTKVFTPLASSAPATSSTSAPSSASASTITSAATTAASTSSSAATTSATQPPEVLRAAGFLSSNLPTPDDGVGAFISAALGLSAAQSCTYSASLTVLVSSLKLQAADYVGTDPARAANLAIAAIALGEDPTSFGGLNLLSILANGTHPDGQVGANASAFAQSLAVIAYVRAGQPVPATLLTNLVAGQDPSGAFGYSFGGTFYPDYDTTGVAIEALVAGHGDTVALSKAVAWAVSEQNGAGYWPNPYSPVDSTGILGSGLVFNGTGVGSAAAWIRTQQLPDGGFPASIDSTTSNVTATGDALWLLAGTNLVTVKRVACSAVDPTASITTGSGASTLADTGSPVEGAVGSLAVAMFVLGAGILVVRRRQRQA